MRYKEIKFLATLEDAFNYQNLYGGRLYINKKYSNTTIEYEIATYLSDISDSYATKRRYVVVSKEIAAIIERKCFTLLDE